MRSGRVYGHADVGAPHRRERIFILAYPARAGGWLDGGTVQGSDARAGSAGASVLQPQSTGRSDVADAVCDGREGCGAAHDDHGRDASRHDVDRRDPALADATGRGQREHGRASGHPGHPDERGAPVADRERDGLERLVLVGPAALSTLRSCGDWPAGPGEPQHAWEPPRTLAPQSRVGCHIDGLPAGVVRHRRQQLEAYGNAIVPQLAEWLGQRLREADR